MVESTPVGLLLIRDPIDDLVIPIKLNQSLGSTFQLTNNTSNPVAMKIKFTDQNKFKCYPNCWSLISLCCDDISSKTYHFSIIYYLFCFLV